MGLRKYIAIGVGVLSAAVVISAGIAIGVRNWGQTASLSDTPSCRLNDVPLKGRVQIVPKNADYRVHVDKYFPQVKLTVVDHAPDFCGEWQFVQKDADFTIMLVGVDRYDLRIRLKQSDRPPR